jgi:hypothetical protein
MQNTQPRSHPPTVAGLPYQHGLITAQLTGSTRGNCKVEISMGVHNHPSKFDDRRKHFLPSNKSFRSSKIATTNDYYWLFQPSFLHKGVSHYQKARERPVRPHVNDSR